MCQLFSVTRIGYPARQRTFPALIVLGQEQALRKAQVGWLVVEFSLRQKRTAHHGHESAAQSHRLFSPTSPCAGKTLLRETTSLRKRKVRPKFSASQPCQRAQQK